MARRGADLLALQGKVKRDPESYEEEFQLQFRHYKACLDIFSLKPSEESHEFADLVSFIAQVASCYPQQTAGFVQDIVGLLNLHYAVLNSSLRQTLAKSLILLRNRNQISALELLPLFFRLFRCQDKSLRQLLFRHIIADIKASNQRHRNDQLNRAIQNFLYGALTESNEAAAKKSLAVLIELWRRQIWRDARTVNVIATAAVHNSSRIMMAALKFLLDQDEATADDSDDEDENVKLANPSKADVYKATKKGTVSSKRKKAAKLKRVMAAVKKQSRKEGGKQQSFAAIQLLHDPQKFVEQLFSRLHKSSGEKFELRLAMMSVISRVVGVHKLLLLNFYPFLQKYVLPHQRDVPQLLAILVQAVHEMVPPETLAPIMRQLVDQFVHDRARPEVMTLGLKTVRELCARAPLVMTAELLQDLALYKKFREKEVASAARGLISLFRELAPAMLEKRDRGRGADMEAAPLAFGAATVQTRVQGAELLQAAEARGDDSSEDSDANMDSEESERGSEDGVSEDDLDDEGAEEGEAEDSDAEGVAAGSDGEADSGLEAGTDSDEEEAGSDINAEVHSEEVAEEAGSSSAEAEEEASDGDTEAEVAVDGSKQVQLPGNKPKRKQEATAGSLSSLKRELAEARAAKRAKSEDAEAAAALLEDAEQPEPATLLEHERILTDEDFARIRELRHRKLVSEVMRKHGLKSASKRSRLLALAQDEADETLEKMDARATLAEQRVDPDSLTGRHKKRQSKEDRLATVLEGREGREFGAASSRKHQKVGGLSNKEKLKRKNLPMGAKKAIVKRRGNKQRVGKKNFAGHVKRLR